MIHLRIECDVGMALLTSGLNLVSAVSCTAQVEAVHLLERFEAWTEKQMHAMEAARNLEKLGQNFDALLKVMDALFQVRRCLATVSLDLVYLCRFGVDNETCLGKDDAALALLANVLLSAAPMNGKRELLHARAAATVH